MELLQIKLLKPTVLTEKNTPLLEIKLHLFLIYEEPCVHMISNMNNVHSVENTVLRADTGSKSGGLPASSMG